MDDEQQGLQAASFAGQSFEVASYFIKGVRKSAVIKGLGTPAYAVSESVLAGVRGTRFNQALMRKRSLTLALIYTANSAEEYFAKRSAILAACNKENGEGQLLFTMGGRQYMVNAVPEPPEIGSPSFPWFGVLLQFTCYDPIIYAATSITTGDITAPGGGGFTFPVFFPIVFTGSTATGRVTVYNDGNVPTYPTVILSGGLTTPVITNETTGEYFKLNYTIPAGRSVTVDMKHKRALLDGGLNVAQYIDTGSTWWALQTGMGNRIRLTTNQPNDTGYYQVVYVPTWGGL